MAQQLATPALVGYPLHVMSKDGSIERSFGGDGGVFHSEDTYKNGRAVCLNPDGSIWSIAWGGRLLERWDTSRGRRIAQVTVKSTWFRGSRTRSSSRFGQTTISSGSCTKLPIRSGFRGGRRRRIVSPSVKTPHVASIGSLRLFVATRVKSSL